MRELSLDTIRSGASPSRVLQTVFLARLKRNPAYSLRAFARDLGVSQTLVSLIFTGKRLVSYRQSLKFAAKLGLGSTEKREWYGLVLRHLPVQGKGRRNLQTLVRPEATPPPRSARVEQDAEFFQVLSEWHHIAILDFSQVAFFREDPTWIGERLGIHPLQARDAIERLLRLGLLSRENGSLIKTHQHLDFTTTRSLEAVREFHRQMSEKAIACLQKTDAADFQRRKITGTTLAIREDRLEEAFRRLEKFRTEMADLLTEGETPADSLYHLNLQLFPLIPPAEKSS